MIKRLQALHTAWLVVTLAGCGGLASPAPPAIAFPQVTLPSSPPAVAATPAPEPTVTKAPPPEPSVSDALASVSFSLPLTVRHVTPDSAMLFFELERPASGFVWWKPGGTPDAAASIMAFNQANTAHSMTLTGLKAGQAYVVKIGIEADEAQGGYAQPGYRGSAWGPVSFRTPSGSIPLRVGVVGDSGMGQPSTAKLAAQMAGQNLDFVIHTGDTVYDISNDKTALDAYALKYYLPFAPLLERMPVYNSVGNHDVEPGARVSGTPFYYRAFPPFVDPLFHPSDSGGLNRWYAFAYGKVQFVVLDSQVFFNEPGAAAQTAWLRERLADLRFAITIPVFHIPPYNAGLHDQDGVAVRRDWQPLFEAAHVPLVLSGHDHNYQRLQVNGITYLISGGGSEALYPEAHPRAGIQAFAQRIHSVVLAIAADRIEVQAIALGGDVLDQAAIPMR